MIPKEQNKAPWYFVVEAKIIIFEEIILVKLQFYKYSSIFAV
jgi:hypothetical protein